MKTKYIATGIFCFALILLYNALLIHRDKKMFEAYDRACAELPTGHPDCVFAKKK